MFGLSYLVRLVFNAYAVGLLVYVIAGWIQSPAADRVRLFLSPFFAPFLAALNKHIRPVAVGTAQVDFTPWVLLFIVIILRELVTWILL